MGITFDNAQTGDDAGYAYTMGVGSNGILVAAYTTTNETGPGGTRFGLSYNGVAMTLVDFIGVNMYMYYMLNPPSGANTLACTGGASGKLSAISYFGVNQVAPVNTKAGVGGTTPLDLDLTMTPSTENSWITAMFTIKGTTMTDRGLFATRVTNDDSTNKSFMGDTNAPISPAQLSSIGGEVTGGGTLSINGIAVVLAPIYASTNFLPLL